MKTKIALMLLVVAAQVHAFSLGSECKLASYVMAEVKPEPSQTEAEIKATLLQRYLERLLTGSTEYDAARLSVAYTLTEAGRKAGLSREDAALYCEIKIVDAKYLIQDVLWARP